MSTEPRHISPLQSLARVSRYNDLLVGAGLLFLLIYGGYAFPAHMPSMLQQMPLGGRIAVPVIILIAAIIFMHSLIYRLTNATYLEMKSNSAYSGIAQLTTLLFNFKIMQREFMRPLQGLWVIGLVLFYVMANIYLRQVIIPNAYVGNHPYTILYFFNAINAVFVFTGLYIYFYTRQQVDIVCIATIEKQLLQHIDQQHLVDVDIINLDDIKLNMTRYTLSGIPIEVLLKYAVEDGESLSHTEHTFSLHHNLDAYQIRSRS